MIASQQQFLLDLESESKDDERYIISHLLGKKRKKSKTNEYLRKRDHGEFKFSSEVPDSEFKESFRLNRKQFNEVHELIKMNITGQECNAQKPIGSEGKLAVCLRTFYSFVAFLKNLDTKFETLF
ncbi:hypothetical protein QTP88_019199 [Uroleucon formosanum]